MVEQEFKDTEIQLDEAENSEKVEESNHQIILTPEEIEALFEEKANKMIQASHLFFEIDGSWVFKNDFRLESPVYEWVSGISVALEKFFKAAVSGRTEE